MTETHQKQHPRPRSPGRDGPLLEIREISKFFGSVISLQEISTTVRAGQVTCILGDNGAGKSTLIKILSGVYQPDHGQLLMNDVPMTFSTPRESLDAGIATVFQDLAMVPLMAIWRNFFLGSEPTKGWGPFQRFDQEKAKRITRKEMLDMGIDIRDPDQPVGTLSGGERQSVAIARAVHFGAKLLILDEPTSALGVKQAGVVLKYIVQARDRGLGVIFITHNPHHAYPVGDRFLLLKRGKSLGDFAKSRDLARRADPDDGRRCRARAAGHELDREGGRGGIGAELAAEVESLPH